MNPAEFRQLFLAWLRQLWTSVRNAPPGVTRLPGVEPEAVPVPHETAQLPPAEAVSASTAAEDLAQAAAHLEYLGYEIRLERDGWSFAQHPYRYDFHLRTFAGGVRLDCTVGVGASIGNSRAAWLEYLNTANERGHVARFSLCANESGACLVRMRALVIGAYSRRVFAMVMDMWHDDLDLVRLKPDFVHKSGVGQDEGVAAVTVN